MKVAEHGWHGFKDLVRCGQVLAIEEFRRFFVTAYPDWRQCTGDEEQCPCRYHAYERCRRQAERKIRVVDQQQHRERLRCLRRNLPRFVAMGRGEELVRVIRSLEETAP